MCEPTTIMAASAAVSVASTIYAARAQAAAAQQTANAQQAANMTTRNQMAEEYKWDDAALQLQQQQLDQQASGQMSERARQAMIERGRLVAAASSNGTGASSAARGEQQVNYEVGGDIATLESNRASNVAQVQRERGAAARGVNNRVSGLTSQEARGVDHTALGLQLIGIAANTGSQYYSYKSSGPKSPSNKAG